MVQSLCKIWVSLHPLLSPKLGQDQSTLHSKRITTKQFPLVLKAYHTLRWAVVLHLGAWIYTLNILALHTTGKPIINTSQISYNWWFSIPCTMAALNEMSVNVCHYINLWLYDPISDSEGLVVSPLHSFTEGQSHHPLQPNCHMCWGLNHCPLERGLIKVSPTSSSFPDGMSLLLALELGSRHSLLADVVSPLIHRWQWTHFPCAKACCWQLLAVDCLC